MKKAVILYTKYSPVIDAIKHTLSDCEVECVTTPNNTDNCDVVILSNYNGEYSGNAICCHHSLLPSFDSDEPEKDAIIEGVKVSGITIFFTNPKRIIMQYPVFITNDMHYDDLVKKLNYLEQTLFPIVIKKILNNEPFDIEELSSKKCGNGCGGCGGCNH